ncbi:F0F1 ATP synthase subunit gamma [Atopobacter phocae]|uniref:F0F1 ATP synthase subunit gamma n=1 Tax=Atopobacter phocae TaxID=136492 RepID=UPI0004715FF2|nr:F0F1 ATP synthase subunit gamma [Atopobacter phocae]
MSASLTDIQKRIDSTQKTSHITSAMQMVSASKLVRSEATVRQYEKYAQQIRSMVTHLVYANIDELLLKSDTSVDETNDQAVLNYLDYHDMLIMREVKKTAYLVIASDQGLAGSYNSSIFASTLEMLKRDHQSKDEFLLICIGETASKFFSKEGYDILYEMSGISDYPTFEEVKVIVQQTVNLYREEAFDELYVCYNHHVNAIVSNFRVEKMLPLVDVERTDEPSPYDVEFLLEPSKEAILEQLIPQYAESLIYGAILDAKAAEHASRMTAMRGATDNARDLISRLTQERNRKRQAQITQEITEIVGGAEALKER